MDKEAVPKQALKQKLFHEHYYSDRQNDIQDYVITLIDSADTLRGVGIMLDNICRENS